MKQVPGLNVGLSFSFWFGPKELNYKCEQTLHCKKKSVKFTVKNWQLWLPEFYRKKYGNNILGFTVLT